MTKLKKIHLPYRSLSTWEIEQARSHTNMHGPGTWDLGPGTRRSPV